MNPYRQTPVTTLYHGDALICLRTLPTESVHAVVTSPPYFGLRSYGVEGQIGLELTPEEYVDKLLAVFHEVHRVLRSDGTLWLNLGDTYAGSGRGGGGSYADTSPGWAGIVGHRMPPPVGLKAKDLIGTPWRIASALQADGWWLRSDIIWAKPNAMPESVTDRPTKSYEHVFLMAKNESYYYDNEAVREANTDVSLRRAAYESRRAANQGLKSNAQGGMPANKVKLNPNGHNLRDVWTIPVPSFKGGHFATFPAGLVRRCILAGTSERGACRKCGAPLERESADWRPTCSHDAAMVPTTVLDPFIGSGTTALVAQQMGRRAIGIDLNEDYLLLTSRRLAGISLPLGLAESREGAYDVLG